MLGAKMAAKVKANWLVTILITTGLGVMISLCSVLYAEQNKKIEKKVDNKTIQQMLCVMDEKNKVLQTQIDYIKYEAKESKEERKEMRKTLQSLNDTMIKIDTKLED